MKTAIIFPGYGSQHVGMGKDLYDRYSIAKDYFKTASDYLDVDLKKICFSSSDQELNRIDNAYLSIYLISSVVYKILSEHEIKIDYLAGYDTGQYASLFAANVITFTQGLDLLNKYAQSYMALLKDTPCGIIQINGLTDTKLPSFLDNRTAIASYQSRIQHLVSGTDQGIADLRLKLNNASGVTIYNIEIGLGLNADLMNPVIEQFVPELIKITFDDPSIPLISNVDGSLITNGSSIKEEIIKLINKPLRWDKVVDKLSEVELIVGIGSQENMLELASEKYPNKFIMTITSPQDIKKITEILATTAIAS